jgi:hypothetical protein
MLCAVRSGNGEGPGAAYQDGRMVDNHSPAGCGAISPEPAELNKHALLT